MFKGYNVKYSLVNFNGVNMFEINNRRYTGSKYKLKAWIESEILSNCKDCSSFCDLFSGTGVISATMLKHFNQIYINDFLVSNEIIYKAFFLPMDYDYKKVESYKELFNKLDPSKIKKNYVSKNFGGKYFSHNDSLLIGEIRDFLEKNKNKFNEKEYSILLASLIYSFDKISNTVGHYEAFIKNKEIKSSFKFKLIKPLVDSKMNSKKIRIYNMEANKLSRKIKADIFYIDPPYSSRQYSRFYHVVETITKWNNSPLYGVAMKPEPTDMSEYSKNKASLFFADLIQSIKSKYIVVSYNNTYNSKSKSSENKMKFSEINEILSRKGKVKVISKFHSAFNAGKTNLPEHKEYLFIVKVGDENE
jgi:adenine-specific DNA-methyltransferase